MPFKANADRRHRIPKQRRRITNWAEYDAALRQRGSLTVWFTEAAIAAWHAEPRTTPGGHPHYSDLAITTALTLKAVFRLALRQTEGLIGSVIRLLGLDLSVPDHTTLICEPGEWPPILVDRPPEPVLRSPDHQAHFVEGAHMWTAPCSQGDDVGLGDLIACAHMSGLLARSHMSAGQGGFRDVRPKHWRDQARPLHLRVRSRLGSTDHTTCSSSCKGQHQLNTDAGLSRPVPGLISTRSPR